MNEAIFSSTVLEKKQTKRISRMKADVDFDSLIRMGFNEHPYGMSPKVLDAVQSGGAMSNYYGDFMAVELKEEIGKFYGMTGDNVSVAAGSSFIIPIVGMTFLNPGDEVLMCPTFYAYVDMAEFRQAKATIVPYKEDKSYNLEGLLDAITDKTKMIVICNPDNPTGQYVSEKEIRDFISKVPDNIAIFVDEAYIEFATAEDCKSMYPLIEEYPNKSIIVLRTFSKFYAMAGVRVGYVLANEEVTSMIAMCPRSLLSKAGLMGGVVALGEQEYYEAQKAKMIEGIKYLETSLKELGCTVYPSQTNFLMFDPHVDCADFRMEIINRGILMNNPMLCRISVGTQEQNELFIKYAKEALDVLR